ncbi:MAG: class I SAM-dependent methyltransferase [Candidatus Methanofastidiosia archaeon]
MHPKKERIKKEYDRSAEFYDRRYKKIQFEKYRGTIKLSLENLKILDLGCGTGLLSMFLSRKDLVGIDLSFKMLKVAKKRCKVVQADIDHLPFRDSIFDLVFSFTSLQNLPYYNVAIREVLRVLKKNGLFIFSILNKKSYLQVAEDVEKRFKILEKALCGEDVSFVCEVRESFLSF